MCRPGEKNKKRQATICWFCHVFRVKVISSGSDQDQGLVFWSFVLSTFDSGRNNDWGFP